MAQPTAGTSLHFWTLPRDSRWPSVLLEVVEFVSDCCTPNKFIPLPLYSKPNLKHDKELRNLAEEEIWKRNKLREEFFGLGFSVLAPTCNSTGFSLSLKWSTMPHSLYRFVGWNYLLCADICLSLQTPTLSPNSLLPLWKKSLLSYKMLEIFTIWRNNASLKAKIKIKGKGKNTTHHASFNSLKLPKSW